MNIDNSVSIVGCGISGIFAALELKKSGIENIKLFDKSRGLGGRLATRRANEGKFDHGIQYIRLDGISHLPEIEDLIKNNILIETKVPDLFVGYDGMTSIAKFLAKDLDIYKEFKLLSISDGPDSMEMSFENGEKINTDSLILSSPIKQSIEILERSSVKISQPKLESIKKLEYYPTIIVMVESESPINLNNEFFTECSEGFFSSITDNFIKGISKKENFYTLVCSHDFSSKNFEKDYDYINSHLQAELNIMFKGEYNILSNHKWRYSTPKDFYLPDDSLQISSNSFIGMCGDIFTNGKFDGAIKSGISVAKKLLIK